mgnify:CR=1 FL=1
MNKVTVLAKLKFDLRDPDEVYLAKYEISSLLNSEVTPIKTIPAIFKEYPFNRLTDEVIHIITRNLYLGEIQGYMAKTEDVDVQSLILKPAFFKEIYLFFEGVKSENKIINDLAFINENLFQIFKQPLESHLNLYVVRLITVQTLFEYVSDILKLPAVAITPRNRKTWNDYFLEKEKGIIEGINELLEHLKLGHYRAPHFGLGKKHIGDFVDWVSTDLRKPFLHYLHKYKGKGDPRISRALINFLKVKKGDTILDPFVGSGSFIADAPTMGINAIGVDILEIGKLISEVKCSLSYDIQSLRKEIIKLFSSTSNKSGGDLFSYSLEVEFKERKIKGDIPTNQIVYLKKLIDDVQDEKVRKFLLVLLSQKIVEFSKRKRQDNFISSFLNYVEDRYLALYATQKLAETLGINLSEGEVKIVRSDATNMDFIPDNSIDGILTSPPYFDALDYVDNNKNSIIILGFVDDLEIGSTKNYYAKFKEFNLELPKSSVELIRLLKNSKHYQKAEIVENYLRMMKLSFKECYRVLKPGRFYIMVISKYHSWVINGEERKIETSTILADLGISEGFKVHQVIQHGLSKADKGKINVEEIIVFQK